MGIIFLFGFDLKMGLSLSQRTVESRENSKQFSMAAKGRRSIGFSRPTNRRRIVEKGVSQGEIITSFRNESPFE